MLLFSNRVFLRNGQIFESRCSLSLETCIVPAFNPFRACFQNRFIQTLIQLLHTTPTQKVPPCKSLKVKGEVHFRTFSSTHHLIWTTIHPILRSPHPFARTRISIPPSTFRNKAESTSSRLFLRVVMTTRANGGHDFSRSYSPGQPRRRRLDRWTGQGKMIKGIKTKDVSKWNITGSVTNIRPHR